MRKLRICHGAGRLVRSGGIPVCVLARERSQCAAKMRLGDVANPAMRLLKLIPDHTEIDFVGVRYFAFAIDGLLLLAAIVSLAWHGLNLGIDFTGGVLAEVKSQQTIDIGAMRAKVDSLGFPEAQLQYFGSGECDTPVNSCVLIRVRPRAEAGGDQEVAKSLQSALGTGYAFRRVEVVGPKVSGELFRDGIVASILAVIMISIYVTVRFEWQYGVEIGRAHV